jgi:hypothetical protein
MLLDLNVGVACGHIEELVGGAHGGDVWRNLLQRAQACWAEGGALLASLHSTLARMKSPKLRTQVLPSLRSCHGVNNVLRCHTLGPTCCKQQSRCDTLRPIPAQNRVL